MRVALYVRVSTDEQATKGNSLLEQEERLKAYCKAMQWDDYEVFIDDGYSAGTLQRPKLQELLSRSGSGEFQMIVTTKIDRLCRNLLDLLTIVDDLESVKCGYASASEAFDTSTPAGKMVLQILGAFAEFERGRTRERVRDNLQSLVKKSVAVNLPCFGYDIVDKRYAINESEAAIIREVADWILAGDGTRVIMKRLNDRDIKTKKGNSFTDDAIRRLMKSETICGMFVYNRRHKHKGKEVVRPREEWIVIEEHHEPIISRDQFDKIQAVITGRARAGIQADNERYLLSGLLKCGYCGTAMNGRIRIKPNKTYHRYLCRLYAKKNECFHHFADRDEIERGVLDVLININDHIAEGEVAENEPEKIDTEKQISSLRVKLGRLDTKMKNRLELYDEGQLSKEDFNRERISIENDRLEINKEIQAIENSSASVTKRIIANALSLREDLSSPDRIRVKNAVRRLVQRIILKDGKVSIEYIV